MHQVPPTSLALGSTHMTPLMQMRKPRCGKCLSQAIELFARRRDSVFSIQFHSLVLNHRTLLCPRLCFFFLPRLRSQVAVPVVKNLPTNTRDERDVGWIPGSGRSPGRGHGNPLQYSYLENPRSPAGYSPWGWKESGTTGAT